MNCSRNPTRLAWPVVAGLGLFAAVATADGAVATAPVDASVLRQEEGLARDPRSGATLYAEHHLIRRAGTRPLERLVVYRCPDGRPFGRKRLDYRASATAPAFAFDDHRSGYREGMRRAPSPMLFFRGKAGAGERSSALSEGDVVVDAGFDEFVREHWARLLSGKPVPVRFAVPSRLRSMRFSLSRVGSHAIAGEDAWLFRLKLDGLLGLVAPSIDVSYGKRSRRLLRFEGLSNLRDASGTRPLVARIDFPRPARPASETDWQSALALTLSGCGSGRTP